MKEVNVGDEVVYKGKWGIVQELFTSYDGDNEYDECSIVDEDGDEKIVFARLLDSILPA